MKHLTLGFQRIGYDLRAYMRSVDAMVFTFFFPLIFLSIFAVAFSDDLEAGGTTMTFASYYLPGMVASGVLLSGMQLTATEIATERLDGTLKRLGATPLSAPSYLIGKFGMVIVGAFVQLIALLAYARLVFGAVLPAGGAAWGRLVLTFFLGLVACALLGVGLAALPRTVKSVTAVILPVVLLLQFISGVYLPFFQLPEWLQNIASVFPVKWIAQGMRSAFFPQEFAAMEITGTWEFGRVLLILGVWIVLGAVMAVKTFRWNRRQG